LHKVVIPSILIATILVAGVFAFLPVQKAVTIHDEIIALINGNFADVFTDLSGIHDWITGGHDTLSGHHNEIDNEIGEIHDWVMMGHDNLSGEHRAMWNALCSFSFGGSGTPGPPPGFTCSGGD